MFAKRSPTHTCFARDCARQVPNKHLMCPDHWKLVPRPLQDRIVTAWKYGLSNRCHPTDDYNHAIVEARQIIAEREAKLMAKANGASPLLAGGAG